MTDSKKPSAGAAEAIEARSREFEANFAKRDARSLVTAYFVEDAEQPLASPPGGGAPVRGRAALIKMFETQFEAVRAIRLELVELDAAPEMAFELGRAHLTLQGGENVKGRYAVQWRNTLAGWRVKIDFFAQDGWGD
jgi:ketosteroid isomerase-like protein